MLRSECDMKEQTIPVSAPVRLEVRITGDPVPSIKWTHNERELSESHNIRIQTEEARSELIIQKSTIGSSGTYKVMAKNSWGTDSMEFNVYITGEFSPFRIFLMNTDLYYVIFLSMFI